MSRPAGQNLDLPKAGWIVEPDPLDKLPLYKAPFRLTIPVKRFLMTYAANQAGITHVAVGDREDDGITFMIVDLTSGTASTPVKVPGNLDSDCLALSPDGKYIAVIPDRAGGRQRPILIFELGTKTVLTLDPGPDSELEILGFNAPRSFVFRERPRGGDATIKVWDIKENKAVRSIIGGGNDSRPKLCFSPTGRYLAMEEASRKIAVYDLKLGQAAGDLTIPGYDSISGISFSPDAQELAVRQSSWNTQKVMSFSALSGRLRLAQDLKPVESPGGEYHSNYAAYFQCLPDNSGYLAGFTLFDVATGNPVYDTRAIGVEPGLPLLRILDSNTLFACSLQSGSHVTVIAAKLPRADIDKALEMVRGGGKSLDATLPPLTPASTELATPVSLMAPEGWTLQADVIKDRTPLTFNGQPLRGTMTGNTGVDYRIKRLAFTGAPANQALISYDVIVPPKAGPNPYDVPLGCSKTIIDRLSLDGKGLLPAFELPAACHALDASTDGKLLLTLLRDRIDLWKAPTADGGKPTHVVGWRPWRPKSNLPNTGSAVVLSPTRVLTINPENTVTVWSVPECSAVWTATTQGVGFEGQYAISPGRKHVALSTRAGVVILDAASGQCLAKLTGSEGLTGALAFHPDGSQLAMVGREICTWDVTSGKLTTRFLIGQPTQQVQTTSPDQSVAWCGTQYLLLGRERLLDLQRMTIVWRFTGQPREITVQQPPDDRLWSITSQRNGHLVAITIPTKDQQQVLAMVPNKPELALEPGCKVSLECNFGDPKLQKETLERLRVAATAAGWQVADAAPAKLVASITRTSRTETYGQGFLGNANQQSVSIPEARIELAIVFEGQTLWSHGETRGGGSYSGLSVREGQTLQGEINRLNEGIDKQFLSTIPPLPPRITKPKTKQGFGASTITPAGLQPFTGRLPGE